MKNLARLIVVGLIAGILSMWVVADVRAMAHPCDELAALDNEANRLREERHGLDRELTDIGRQLWLAWTAYSDRCSELGVSPHYSPDILRWQAEIARASGYDDIADQLESIADELDPLWNEYSALQTQFTAKLQEIEESQRLLDSIRSRRGSLMQACAITHQIPVSFPPYSDMRTSNPMEPADSRKAEIQTVRHGGQVFEASNNTSGDRSSRPNRNADSDVATPSIGTVATPMADQMENPMGRDENQQGTPSNVIPVVTPEMLTLAQSGEGQVAVPETNASRLPKPQLMTTAPSQNIQVQQAEDTSGGTNLRYTHMPTPSPVVQSGVGTSRKTFRIVGPMRQFGGPRGHRAKR
jgi:hypothetical protein